MDCRYRLTRRECYDHYPTWSDHLHVVRRLEFQAFRDEFGGARFNMALEIGSGDGFQSELLAPLCDKLVCTDVNRIRWDVANRDATISANVSHAIMSGADLSQFHDGMFDLVFSSNALEHIENVERCLQEMHRVLKPSGIAVLYMPSRYWKFFNALYRISRIRRPNIHGIAHTNVEEFILFGKRVWIKKIMHAGFVVEKTVPMPFYFGVGLRGEGPASQERGGELRWRPLLLAGNYLGLPSSHMFVCRMT